ncbi:hypothetical protein GGD92_16970 [Pseudomonas protegens]|uniref:Lipoprotein n=1 Tax=Pseudomonas protegens TaxID=380021 RepID=A0A7G8YEI4_9PSED|nr:MULTISPECIES: hypothetical protein [Pseudomonas]QNH79851.1 hypothetical protein GGI48_12045 [Pseudomonas protegens]QNL03278.1 hypothetical protein GGD92_16970 [Pseudomonas protegens]RBJ81592.1 hypothetical protein C3L29_018190 [Pseudomonas sp. MWU12-2534b]
MIGGGRMAEFLARYFPIFMLTVLLGCFSASLLLSLCATTYWRGMAPAQRDDYLLLGLLLLIPLLVLGNLLIVRGVAWAVWLVAGYFLTCLLLVVPMFQYRPHQGVYLCAMLVPLLGLLLLNSRRYREMRERLLEIRHERRRLQAAARQPRKRR